MGPERASGEVRRRFGGRRFGGDAEGTPEVLTGVRSPEGETCPHEVIETEGTRVVVAGIESPGEVVEVVVS